MIDSAMTDSLTKCRARSECGKHTEGHDLYLSSICSSRAVRSSHLANQDNGQALRDPAKGRKAYYEYPLYAVAHVDF